MSKVSKRQEGFTLIEILVVVALIAILAAITIVAMNPAKNFADTRNATRSSDVNAIINAVTQYTSESGNSIADLGTISDNCATPTCIGTFVATPPAVGSCVDLGATLVDEWIVAIPEDPTSGNAENTGYTICRTTSGRVQIDAATPENNKVISVKR